MNLFLSQDMLPSSESQHRGYQILYSGQELPRNPLLSEKYITDHYQLISEILKMSFWKYLVMMSKISNEFQLGKTSHMSQLLSTSI